VSSLVAMNRYYAGFMAAYLGLPPELIRVVPPGLNLAGHGVKTVPGTVSPLTIGYLARICPEKGLHQLAAALAVLAADGQLPPLRMLAAGYLDSADRPYLAGIRRQLAGAGMADRFQYVGELDRAGKIAFLERLDLFCLPTVYPASKGLSVLEAWASGVPAVLPAQGAFPELIADTGGGLVYEPGNLTSLTAALKRMILDAPLAGQCGRTARTAVHERYNSEVMARRMIELYEGL
jgi:glycosyltransferase involved in cell wall biosynthesis